MTDFNFLSPEGFARIKAMHRLQTVLMKEKREYLRTLHTRCAVGMPEEQFDNIVQMLSHNGWCTLQKGAFGSTLVILNEQPQPVEAPVETVQ